MLKSIFFFFLFLSSAFAQKMVIAQLEEIYSNAFLRFSTSKYSFLCHSYGIVSLEELYANAQKDSQCKKNIEQFYGKYKEERYFSLRHLKQFQFYHIELKGDGKCIVYAKGEISLSQMLLREGLALKKPYFKDKEFKYSFTNAQKNAKFDKKGLWKEHIREKCISEYYK